MKLSAPLLGILSLGIAMFVLPGSAGAQLTLYPGDSYTFSFSMLPDSSIGYYGYSPSGGFSFHISDFEAGIDQLLFHLFEDTPEELSVAGGVAEGTSDGTALPNAYADFNGGAVFTMLAGSVTLEDITFSFQEPVDDINSLRHSLTIVPQPVPEAGAPMLAALGMLIPLLRRVRFPAR